MRTALAVAAVAVLAVAGGAPAVPADDAQALKGQAVANIKVFASTLKGELVKAMKDGGPVNAIAVCNARAPRIAARVSAESGGWTVGRTSLKLRNPNNAPDAWESKVLAEFEARKKAGDPVDKLAVAQVVETSGGKEFRFMKAIPTGEICLKCHGPAVAGDVAAKLESLYPGDQARGFSVGDIRGAFTLRKPL